MKTMTIREIAALCEAGDTTIRRWAELASAKMAEVGAKMADAAEKKKPARFTLPETLAIIRAGGKNTLAALLEENAKPQAPAQRRLPAGVQLRELRLIYGAKEAGARLDALIGYPPTTVSASIPKSVLHLPEPEADPAIAKAVFASAAKGVVLPTSAIQRAAKSAAAAAQSTIRREIDKAFADQAQGRLPI